MKKIAVLLLLCGGLAAWAQNPSVVPVSTPPSTCYPVPLFEYQAGSTVYVSGPGNTCVALGGGGGSGTVGSGTTNQLAYYPSNGTTVGGTSAIPNGITATTQTNSSDASTEVATNQFVQNAINLTMGTTPLNFASVASPVSFDSQGSGATIVVQASSGVINNILTWSGGSSYVVGDVITPQAGNYDAMIQVTTVSSGAPTAGVILYGGTGYGTGGSFAGSAANSIQYTFLLSGALANSVRVIMPHGTYLTQSNQWIFADNTTGNPTYSINVCVAGATDACAATGRTVTLVEGTNNSTSAFVQTDGELNVDFAVGYLPHLDDGVTTANTITSSEPVTAPSFNAPGDGTHAGRLSLYPNTTAPTLPSGDFSILGPNSASITAYAWQAPTATNVSAGVMHVGAESSNISQLTVSQVANADLVNTATTVNGQTCTLGSSCTIPFQTNSSSNTSQAGINLETSSTNSIGITITPTNTATNVEKFEATGTYSGGISSSQVTTGLGYTPANCTAGTTGSDCLTLSSGLVPTGNLPGYVANVTFTISSSTTINANSCSPASGSAGTSVTMTGLTSTMALSVTPNADITNTTGWGNPAAGVLYITLAPGSGSFTYHVCNNTASNITTGGSATFNVSAH